MEAPEGLSMGRRQLQVRGCRGNVAFSVRSLEPKGPDTRYATAMVVMVLIAEVTGREMKETQRPPEVSTCATQAFLALAPCS